MCDTRVVDLNFFEVEGYPATAVGFFRASVIIIFLLLFKGGTPTFVLKLKKEMHQKAYLHSVFFAGNLHSKFEEPAFVLVFSFKKHY
jgi:hypothetical protein